SIQTSRKVSYSTLLKNGRHARDYTLYTGALGTAFLVFRAYQVTKNGSDLSLCSNIVKASDSASEDL
ncbi:hypothetical protein S245_027511, partial [Arachis hypogaea]